MKIQLCQTNIDFENKLPNIIKAESLLKTSNADVLFFPEMSFTGFSMNTATTGENNSYTLNLIKSLAQKYNKAIGFGWVYKNNSLAENHYTFIDNKGNILSDYIKIHPFSYSGEDKYFKKGNKVVVYKYNNFNICNLICYDLRFPEIFQIASRTADIITVAANWPSSRRDHWITLLKARAIENMCYILAINCVGNINSLDYSGDSCIINPKGEILDILTAREGNIILDIKNDVEKFRQEFPTRNDRREDLYYSN